MESGKREFSQRGRAGVLIGCFLFCLFAAGGLTTNASAATRAFLFSFDGSSTGVSPLRHPTGLAVDESSSPGKGNVLLADGTSPSTGEASEAVDIFGAGGEVPAGVASPYQLSHGFAFGGEPIGVALDNSATSSSKGDLYVADIFKGVVEKFGLNPSSEEYEYVCELTGVGGGCSAVGGTPTEAFGEPTGVGVDSHGNLYVSSYTNEVIDEFGPEGEDIRQIKSSLAAEFQLGRPAQIAFDSAGNLYVQQYEGAKAVLEYAANPSGEVEAESEPRQIDPGASYGVAVDRSTDTVYVLHQNHVAQYSSTGALEGEFGSGQIGSAGGIAVNAETGAIYVSDPEKVEVEVFGPFPVAAPTIDSTSASNASADSVDLSAEINPNTLATDYHFEYGLGDCSAVPDPCTAIPAAAVAIGSGHEDVAVSQHLAGLAPATTYHYRVLAHNSLGTTPGSDHTFTTQTAGLPFALPDARAWELVSPADKHSAKLTLPNSAEGGITQAAAGGDGLTYLSLGSIEAAPEGNRALEPSQVLARHGATGWASKDITLPHSAATPLSKGQGYEYRYFGPDLASAVVEPRDDTVLSPQASERTLYLRANFPDPAAYRPLVTAKEGYANVPPGTEFGGEPPANGCGERYGCPLALKGANRDLSHVILRSQVPLAAGAAVGSLYEWADGRLQAISVLPAGEGGAVVEGELGGGDLGVRGAVSSDGSRVFWNHSEGSSGNALYVRDSAAEVTLRLDEVQPGASGSGAQSPVFQGASADGSKVFFTDSQQLTADANTSGADLYECEMTFSAGKLGCALTDLTPNAADPAEGADVQGVISGFGEAGNAVYLVANGALASRAGAGDCTGTGRGGPEKPGETCNLYALHYSASSGEWETRFVAVLAGADRPDWGEALEHPGEGFGGDIGAQYLSASSSPDGQYLTFMSNRTLTDYDNRDASSGLPAQEVYLYDARTEALTCASCNPTGARPNGIYDESDRKLALLYDPLNLWEGHYTAAILPDPIQVNASYSPRQPRSVLDDGRVFFNAADALVPADSNGTWDVYEYEPSGTDGCGSSPGTAAVAAVAGGCVGLISSGTAEEESAFLDASESGDDAFFLAAAKLASEDTDPSYDVYDAHVCGAGWLCPARPAAPPAPCASSEVCRPPLPAPAGNVPGSSVLSGNGNVKPKRHKHHMKHRRHHKPKHQKKKHQKREHHRRGAGGSRGSK
jgi:hypothetical protein